MTEDELTALKNSKIPSPSETARQRALGLALEAYDDADKKNAEPTQGFDLGARLRSIRNWTKGKSIMDQKFPIAAALGALLLIPASVYLMQSTALTPIDLARNAGGTIVTSQNTTTQDFEVAKREQVVKTAPINTQAASEPVGRIMADDIAANGAGKNLRERKDGASDAHLIKPAPAQPEMSPAPQNLTVLAQKAHRSIGVGGLVAAPPSGDQFESFDDNKVKSVATEPVSTFSIDVDTASYAYVRRMLESGQMPNPDSVRVEELINYFSYDYDVPTSLETPFTTNITVSRSPFDTGKQIVRIGIKGYQVPLADRQPANLVFLIDTSGSMSARDKLPLLKRSFALLLDQLDARDTITIVTYAGAAGVVLEPTSATEKTKILDAIETLTPGGSTAGASGIKLAYQLAESAKTENNISRVIMATDGDFNVGISTPQELQHLIEDKRDGGVFLSILGFGTGNLNDQTMQTLTQNGNGTAYYIDSFREAQKVLVTEIGATLVPIAKDVKIQVEFNPATVAEYRLIGYETRALNREDFNNDRVDAGDVGSGHTVTALYEITPVGSKSLSVDPLRYDAKDKPPVSAPTSLLPTDEIGFFKLRYKLPNEDKSQLLTASINTPPVTANVTIVDDDTRFAIAVAAFGQKLRGNIQADALSYEQIKTMAGRARGQDANGYRAEFLALVDIAKSLDN